MSLKQVILVRTDLKMDKGKIAAQVGHAVTDSILKSSKEKIEAWRKEGMKKVVLKVKDEKELLEYKKKASGLVTSLVIDAGRTQVDPGTKTCLAIGPDEEEKIDKITGKLKIL